MTNKTFTVSIRETRYYSVEVEAKENDKLGAIEAALATRDTWRDEAEAWGEDSNDYIAREHRLDEAGNEYNAMSDLVIYSETDLRLARQNGGFE